MEGHPRQGMHPVGRYTDQPTGFHGCDNKEPQTCWFKTTEMYSNYSGGLASNISIDRLKSKGGRAVLPPEAPGEKLLLPASRGQLAFSASAASLSS